MSLADIEGQKNFWVTLILIAILLFFANLGLRYLFEKEINIFYSLLITLVFILLYFAVAIFLNIRKKGGE